MQNIWLVTLNSYFHPVIDASEKLYIHKPNSRKTHTRPRMFSSSVQDVATAETVV